MSEIERSTMRKVVRRFAPLLTICFIAAFLDRVNVGFAAITMNKDLGLSSAAFGLGAGLFFLGYFLFEIPSNSGHKVKTASEYKAYLRRNFGNLTHRAEEAFPVKTDADVLKALSDLYSEAQYGYGVREMLLHYTAYEPFVYRYRFTLDRNGSSTRPIHGAELQYPFENLSALQRGSVRPFNETDINVSRSMSAAWARFIQTGNPNGGELPNWPTYSEGREQLMEFGRQIHVGEFQPTPGFSVIKDYYQQKRTERR